MTDESVRSSCHHYYSQHHQDALVLEISLLRSTLRRNRASHRRTLYWRRAQMVLTCIDRQGLVELYEAWQTLLEQRDLLPLLARRAQRKQRNDHQEQREDQWHVAAVSKNSASTTRTPLDDDDDDDDPDRVLLTAWHDRLENLARRTTDGITECGERIDYCARAVVAELVRGFFLPLLTVVAASLARIRVLLFQRLRQHVANSILIWRTRSSLTVHCNPKSSSSTLVEEDVGDGGFDDDDTTRRRLAELVERLSSEQTASFTDPDAVAMQKYAENKFSRSERTAAALQSLGLEYFGSTNDDDNEDDDREDSTKNSRNSSTDVATPEILVPGGPEKDNNSDDDDTPPDKWNTGTVSLQSQQHPSITMDVDVGVGIVVASAASSLTGSAPPSQPPLDANAMMLEQLRRDQPKKPKKRSQPLQDRSRSSGTKPKKKKKAKSVDFFDELFGGG